MKSLISSLLLVIAASTAMAADSSYYSRAIFFDDFSSNSFGPRWGHYKSSSVVKDGVLVGITAENSDHSAVDSIKFPGERDLEVTVKFRFVSDKAKSFNVWFDDYKYKGSHAGHICSVSVSPKTVIISDAKTGNFRNDLYEKQTAPGGLSAEDKAYIQTKRTQLPVTVSLKEWHGLMIHTRGDQAEVSIDGKVIGSFKSEGITHDTKSLVSLTTNRIDVEYDDFGIKAGGDAPKQ